jgi:acyl-CoA synthetase (AMP-forming)/AMP-acid ligase II
MYAHMYRGNTNVAVDRFDPKLILEVIEKERITHVFLVPSMIIFTLEYPDVRKYDLSSLRLIWYGGSPMPVDRIKQAMEVFGCDLGQGFGMTEIGPCFVSSLSPSDHRELIRKNDEEKLSSVGKNYSNTEVKIVDDEDREVPINTVGEICVRGQNVMKGYWKMPEETQEALKGGWFHTGDLGRIDDDGYLYVVDRKKDMIISGAENIYSAEVENVLSSHPAVLEVAVIGVPDEQWGEAVKAIVALREGMTATEEELIEHCKKNLASYKKPKSIEFVDALPRNVMGKVLKRELREKYWKGYKKRVH